MNFAVSRPHALPRALSQPPEDPQKAKTPTPEPFDVETRKVRSGQVQSGWSLEQGSGAVTIPGGDPELRRCGTWGRGQWARWDGLGLDVGILEVFSSLSDLMIP